MAGRSRMPAAGHLGFTASSRWTRADCRETARLGESDPSVSPSAAVIQP
jgi:hypothetical protein